jgi:ABC-type multidrug transport system fused ATPase/permease subunit
MAFSFGGAAVAACTFGAGLGMILPTLHLLLEQQQTLGDLVTDHLAGPERVAWKRALGNWLLSWLPTGRLAGFALVMGVIFVLSIIGTTATFVREFAAITLAFRASMQWRGRLFRRLVDVPIETLLRDGGSDRITRVLLDTRIMSGGYQMLLGRSLGEILGMMAALTVALVINWSLTMIALITVPVIVFLLRTLGRTIRRATRRALHQQGRMINALNESIGNLMVVKVHSAEGQERRRFAVINRAVYEEEMRARRAKALSSPLLKTLSQTAMIAVALVAAWLTFERGVPATEFMTVLAALAAAGTSAKPLSSLNNQIHEASAAARRVMEVLDLPEEEPAETGRRLPALARHAKSVVFESVGYTYPNAEMAALRDVTLEVGHGETVAIVGANGSGKTTLLSLLPRLLKPSNGRVLVDGTDVSDVRIRSLRDQLGVVSQQAVLFQGTIADNIAYGRHYVPRERIVDAAKAAYADEFIAGLPDRYETMLGEGGTGLSGGQKQRVCIARALLRDPAIMILDEATSQIDSDSEAKINQALRDLRRQRTTFVIAHRLSTVIDADRIVVMEAGRIVDQGTHDELLERCKIYQTLTQTQLQPA